MCHSLGTASARILYSAVNQSLIEALSGEKDIGDESRPVTRFADMVLLINPAFGALQQVAKSREQTKYRAPIFVAVTSTADLATRYAFPLGRIFSTLFQRPTSSAEQGEAISKTMGHHRSLYDARLGQVQRS